MKVTREKTEQNQAYLTVEMEPDELKESWEQAYKSLSRQVKVPGFRSGKAPRAILERHVGRDAMVDEAIKDAVPRAYEKAIAEQQIQPVAQPEIEITQTDPVIFKAIVPLPPTVELGDYKSVRLMPDAVEIKEEDIDSVLERLRHDHATWDPVERPAELMDMATIDIDSTIEEEPYIKRIGMQYNLIQDASFPVPGFADQVKGMKAGEEKEFNLRFPADYTQKELANKEGSFKIKLTEIKQEKLPELNADFVKQVKADLETAEALREEIRKSLQQNAEDKAKIDFEEKVVDTVADQAILGFPPVFVDSEIDRIIRSQLRRWQLPDDKLADYLRMINKSYEEFREELKPMAVKNVSGTLVLDKIAEDEKIEATEADVDAEVEKMNAAITEDVEKYKQMLNSPGSRQSLKLMIVRRKTIEYLTKIAKGEDKAVEKAAESESKEG
ncbi:trigger factor [Chloroflexota bacterium]